MLYKITFNIVTLDQQEYLGHHIQSQLDLLPNLSQKMNIRLSQSSESACSGVNASI